MNVGMGVGSLTATVLHRRYSAVQSPATWGNTTPLGAETYPLPAVCTPLHETLTTAAFANHTNAAGDPYSQDNLIISPGTVRRPTHG